MIFIIPVSVRWDIPLLFDNKCQMVVQSKRVHFVFRFFSIYLFSISQKCRKCAVQMLQITVHQAMKRNDTFNVLNPHKLSFTNHIGASVAAGENTQKKCNHIVKCICIAYHIYLSIRCKGNYVKLPYKLLRSTYHIDSFATTQYIWYASMHIGYE